MTLKFDNENAYDKMQWGFILETIGIFDEWIDMVKQCILSLNHILLIDKWFTLKYDYS